MNDFFFNTHFQAFNFFDNFFIFKSSKSVIGIFEIICKINILSFFLKKVLSKIQPMKATTLEIEEPKIIIGKSLFDFFLGIPWYLYAILAGSISIIVGLVWDISWHMSIGRDTLLSPPHLAIYLGGAGSGIASGFKVLKTTFWGTEEEKNHSVTIWGFKGPLGGWFCIWGAFAMLTSAPFDDWWHNTYGLDVKILSPPHVVLLLGMVTIQLGAFFIIMPARAQNNFSFDEISERRAKRLEYMYALAAGILIGMMAVTIDDYA
jgi:hypothetical protein